MLTREFSPGISTTYGTFGTRSSAWIRASVLVDPVIPLEPRELSLVITREKDGRMLDYFTSYYDGMPAMTPGMWNKIETAGLFRNAHGDDVIKAYLWNPGRHGSGSTI